MVESGMATTSHSLIGPHIILSSSSPSHSSPYRVIFLKAYTVGSAFYGLYFVVSYPLFFTLDEPMPLPPPPLPPSASPPRSSPASSLSPLFAPHTLRACVCEALAAGMLVLMLLDGVRVRARAVSAISAFFVHAAQQEGLFSYENHTRCTHISIYRYALLAGVCAGTSLGLRLNILEHAPFSLYKITMLLLLL